MAEEQLNPFGKVGHESTGRFEDENPTPTGERIGLAPTEAAVERTQANAGNRLTTSGTEPGTQTWFSGVGDNIRIFSDINILAQEMHDQDEWSADMTDVFENEDQLLDGIIDKEEHKMWILSSGNTAIAQRRRDIIIDEQTRSRSAQNQSGFDSFTGAVVGSILDPIGIGAIGVGLKFGNVAHKATVALGAGRVAAAGAEGAIAGTAEELLRNLPRLAADETFKFQDYKINVLLGVVAGTGLSVAGTGLRTPVGKGMNKIVDTTSKLLHEYKVDVVGRTAMNTARDVAAQVSDKGIKDAVANMDVKSTIHTARDAARTSINNELKEVDVSALTKALRDMTGDSPDMAVIATTLNDAVDNILTATGQRIDDPSFIESVEGLKDALQALEAFKDPTIKVETPAPKPDGTPAEPKPEPTLQSIYDDIEKGLAKVTTMLEKEGNKEGANQAAIRAGFAKTQRVFNAAKLSVFKQGERQGIPIRRKTPANIDEQIAKAIHETFDPQVASDIDELLKGFNHIADVSKLFEDLPSGMVGDVDNIFAKYLTDILGEAEYNPNSKRYASTGKRMSNKITSILKLPEADQLPALTKLNEDFDVMFNNIREMYDATPGSIEADDLVLVNNLIDDVRDKFLSVADYVAMIKAHPHEDLVKLNPKWAMLSAKWEESVSPEVRAAVRDGFNTGTQKVISNQFGALTNSMSSRLIRSGSPLAEFFAHNILEVPTGTGGAMARQDTAAILAVQWDQQFIHKTNTAWEKAIRAHATARGQGLISRNVTAMMSPNQSDSAQELSRWLQLEMNARRMNTDSLNFQSSYPPYVKDLADTVSEVNEGLYKLQNEHSIDGITGKNQMSNYVTQRWKDGGVLDMLEDPNIAREGVEELLETALRNFDDKLDASAAKAWASTIVDEKIKLNHKHKSESFSLNDAVREGDLPSNSELLAAMHIKLRNMPNRDKIMENIRESMRLNDNGGPGYTQKRAIHVDLSTEIQVNGRTISMLDIMDNDVIGGMQRYSKQATAMSAISRASDGAIRSEADMDSFLLAMGQQAAELSTHVNTKDVRNIYMAMVGGAYEGQLPMTARMIRDAVALAGMNGLGESQLAELGLAMNRGMAGLVGFGQTMSRQVSRAKRWKGLELTKEQAGNADYMRELQELTGLFEDMHIIERRNVHFDSTEKHSEMSFMQKAIDAGTGGKYRPYMQYLQARYTGYGVLKSMEEQIAMAGVMQDFAKKMTGRKAFTSDARFADIGLMMPDGTSKFKKYFDDGTIIIEDGKIKQLNLAKWSTDDQTSLGVALRRHSGQQVQVGYAGELSPEMQNPVVAMLMQFKTYPIIAAEKQQGRNAKFANGMVPDQELAMGLAINAFTAAMSRSLRYHSLSLALPEGDRAEYLEKKHQPDAMFGNTLAYMGIAGMFPQINEHMGQLGLPSLDSNARYGDDGLEGVIPAMTWANNYIKAGQGAANLFTGQGTADDLTKIGNGIPLGTIMQGNVIQGIIKQAMLEDAP